MKPGATTTPGRIDAVRIRAVEPGHRLEDPVADHDLARAFATGRRVDEPGPPDVEVRHLPASAAPTGLCVPASRYSSAIRTATPLVTWSVMTEFGAGGDVGGDLDALVHRARMHDERARASPAGGARRSVRTVPRTRAATAAAPTAIRSRWIRSAITTSASRSASSTEVVTWNRRPAAAPRRRPRLEPAQQRRRAAQPQVRAGRGQRPDVGARHARVEQVAEDHDLAARERRVAEVRRGSCRGRAAPASGGRASRRRR